MVTFSFHLSKYFLDDDVITFNADIAVSSDIIKKGTAAKISLPYLSDPLWGDMDRKEDVVIYNKSGRATNDLILEALGKQTDKCAYPHLSNLSNPDFKRDNVFYGLKNRKVTTTPVVGNLDVVSIQKGQMFESKIKDMILTFFVVETSKCHVNNWIMKD